MGVFWIGGEKQSGMVFLRSGRGEGICLVNFDPFFFLHVKVKS